MSVCGVCGGRRKKTVQTENFLALRREGQNMRAQVAVRRGEGERGAGERGEGVAGVRAWEEAGTEVLQAVKSGSQHNGWRSGAFEDGA
jgi:hypothetical protein